MLRRALVVLAAALVFTPAAQALRPEGLHAFVLRANEPTTHSFSQTPSFAWDAVPRASRYEFQLATSSRFSENSIVWWKTRLDAPLATIPITLPWMSGAPYSWYARVRAYRHGVPTRWSKAFGFDLDAPAPPQSLSSGVNPHPGLLRWTPVVGATGYEFNYMYDPASGNSRTWSTPTTAADLREVYMFHNDVTTGAFAGLVNIMPIQWRVRAVRVVSGKPRNHLPVVSKGRWSPVFSTTEADLDTLSPISLGGSVSRADGHSVTSTKTVSAPHELFPAFYWSGALSSGGLGACPSDVASLGADLGAFGTQLITCPLFHVYVFSDRHCVNRVYTSDLVGSPAFAPRLEKPLDLPATPQELGEAAAAILGNAKGKGEGVVKDVSDRRVYAAGTQPGAPKGARETGLPDVDFSGGRYWWTVVPAVPHVTPDDTIEYRDVALPQDECEAGNYMAFSKSSPAAANGSAGVPYVSGEVANGRVSSARKRTPAFYGRIVAAWRAVPGAHTYELQVSRRADPWKVVSSVTTAGTAVQLDLPPGLWHYRVRGIDTTIPGTQQGMTWSAVQAVRVLPTTFVVSHAAARR